MELEKKIYYSELYDLYSSLLTKYQADVFRLYYQEDFSLFEIAEEKDVSRNAIFTLIHRVEMILLDYEEKLHLHSKYKEIKDILNNSNVDNKIINKIENIIER